MLSCTFFGHRNVTENIEEKLMLAITKMITDNNVKMFYVGNNGSFDEIVRSCLKRIKNVYPCINYYVVLAYLPATKSPFEDYSDTVFPDRLEILPRKFAITERNKWMIEKSEYVIAYVLRSTGGASKFMEPSEKKGKIVVNIA